MNNSICIVPWNPELVRFFEAEVFPVLRLDDNYRVEEDAFANLCRKVGKCLPRENLNISPISKADAVIWNVGEGELKYVSRYKAYMSEFGGWKGMSEFFRLHTIVEVSNRYIAVLEYFNDIVRGPCENTNYKKYSQMSYEDFFKVNVVDSSYFFFGESCDKIDPDVSRLVYRLLYTSRDAHRSLDEFVFGMNAVESNVYDGWSPGLLDILTNVAELFESCGARVFCDKQKLSPEYIENRVIKPLKENINNLEYYLENGFLLGEDINEEDILSNNLAMVCSCESQDPQKCNVELCH